MVAERKVVIEHSDSGSSDALDQRDLFDDYDPDAARAALNRVFGIFKGIDTEALKADLRAQREQDTPGRPA